MMTMWLRSLMMLVLLAAVAAAPAQTGGRAKRAPVVTATARLEPAEARRGQEVRLIVTAVVDSKYHLYAMKQPDGAEGPVPTEVVLPEELLAVLEETGAAWEEPPAKVKFDLGFERDVAALYGSPLEFRRTVRIKADAKPGAVSFEAGLLAQACTETSCLPPSEYPFTLAFTVLDGEPVAAPVATPAPAKEPDAPAAKAPAAAPAAAGAVAAQSTESRLKEQGFGGFLLTSFLFGLIALATPCVFPMIPITISFFTEKGKQPPAKAIGNALVYVGSIIVGFTLIGFGISMLLLAVGAGVESSGFANQLASNPWLNLFFAALYGAFALSLFEVFSIGLPAAWTARLNKSALGRSDIPAIAAKAMVFVIVSFTCTAPLIGVLIVQTLSGEWTRPLFGMLAFATGFSLPFFLLALAPQWLASLPKAGSWLYAVKVVMGMMVLAASFKFLSNADLVLLQENLLLTREVLLAVWTALVGVTAAYLFGWIRLPDDEEGTRIGVPRLLLGTLFAAGALYLAAGLFGARLNVWVEAYLPPEFETTTAAAAPTGSGKDAAPLPPERTATGGTKVSAGYSWYEEVEPALAQARKLGRNVFVDFTGYSCTNCRLMEKQMFPRPEVVPLLSQYVRVKLYTDDRKEGARHRAYQAEKFNTVTLPFYAILTPDGQVLATAEYSTDVAAYAAFLRTGL